MSKITSYVLFLLCVARDQVSLWKGGTIVYATLLDAGQYLCSERTMYRVLAAHQEVRERRDQLRHPAYAAPDLLARRPNGLWSWDITNHVKEIYGVCRRRVDLPS